MSKKQGFILDYNKIEKTLWDMAEPLAAAAGCQLIDVEFVKEAGSWYVRVFIDREPPVDHALCEQVSDLLGEALDKADPISQSYFLEVSSPGLERPLKREADFIRFAGRQVLAKLYSPLEGRKEFSGQLLGLNDGQLALKEEDGGELLLPLNIVAHVRLVAELD